MSNQDLDVALTYHAETKHSYDSVYRDHHFLDWDNQPRPYKDYRTLTPIALPPSLPETQHPALHNLTPAETVSDPLRLPTLADLAYVLFYAAGVTKRRVLPGYGDMLFRAAACTGALYHIELYIAVAELPDLPAGVYHFSPVDFALRCLRQGDFRQALVEASAHAAGLVTGPSHHCWQRYVLAQCLEVSRQSLSSQFLGCRYHAGQFICRGHGACPPGPAGPGVWRYSGECGIGPGRAS